MPAPTKPRRGAPPGNRRAAKYDEPTIQVSARLPESLVTSLDRLAEGAGRDRSEQIAALVQAATATDAEIGLLVGTVEMGLERDLIAPAQVRLLIDLVRTRRT